MAAPVVAGVAGRVDAAAAVETAPSPGREAKTDATRETDDTVSPVTAADTSGE